MEETDMIFGIFGVHNDAAVAGIELAAQKLASEYGDEVIPTFEGWLATLDEGEVFDTDAGEKTASTIDPAVLEKYAEAEELGRMLAHVIYRENRRLDKIASDVSGTLIDAFVKAHGR
jgi:hypothetical protein